MRLNLYWHGFDLIDVELHAFRRRPNNEPDDDGPTLRANGGGSSERADTYGDPATIAQFGFCAGKGER